MSTYICRSMPKGATKLRVIKEIREKSFGFASCPHLPEGSITWLDPYIKDGLRLQSITIEDNRYGTNFDSSYFEIVVDTIPRKESKYRMGDTLKVIHGSWQHADPKSPDAMRICSTDRNTRIIDKVTHIVFSDTHHNFWYKLGSYGNYICEDGVELAYAVSEDSPTPFGEVQTMSVHDARLIEEAKKKYPVGTYVYQIYMDGNINFNKEIKITNLSRIEYHPDGEIVYDNQWRLRTSCGNWAFIVPVTSGVKEDKFEYVELLSGFDDKYRGQIFCTHYPLPKYEHWNRFDSWDELLQLHNRCFNSSTKEAYDEQVVRPVEKYDPNTFEKIEPVDMKAVLKETQTRYPIGTKVANHNLVNRGMGCAFTITQVYWKSIVKDELVYVTQAGSMYTVYKDGKWAEVISLPGAKVKPDLDSLVGRWVQHKNGVHSKISNWNKLGMVDFEDGEKDVNLHKAYQEDICDPSIFVYGYTLMPEGFTPSDAESKFTEKQKAYVAYMDSSLASITQASAATISGTATYITVDKSHQNYPVTPEEVYAPPKLLSKAILISNDEEDSHTLITVRHHKPLVMQISED